MAEPGRSHGGSSDLIMGTPLRPLRVWPLARTGWVGELNPGATAGRESPKLVTLVGRHVEVRRGTLSACTLAEVPS